MTEVIALLHVLQTRFYKLIWGFIEINLDSVTPLALAFLMPGSFRINNGENA
jgi:hypothetical protein